MWHLWRWSSNCMGIHCIATYTTTTYIPFPVGVRAEATADNTSIMVSWKWSCQGVQLDLVRVHYQPEGGSLMMYQVDNTTATSATLLNLQCNTKYTVWVYAEGGGTGIRSVSRMVSLPARGIHFHMAVYCMYTILLYHPSPSHSH